MKTTKNKPLRLITNGPDAEPAHDAIAVRAYSIWEQKGHAAGQDVENWLHAENQLRHAPSQDSARA